MKKGLLIFSLFFSIHGFSQETSIQNSKWKIGLSFSPDYSYRKSNSNFKQFEGGEKAKFGFTSGLTILYSLSENISFESGILYSNKGYSNDLENIIFGDQFDPRYGFVDSLGNNPNSTNNSMYSTYNCKFIDVPFRVIMQFGNNKIKFAPSFGIVGNFIIASNTVSTFNGETKKVSNDVSQLRTLNISPSVSFGISKEISSKLNVMLEPTFRYALLTITDSNLSSQLWNLGLNMGVYYSLK